MTAAERMRVMRERRRAEQTRELRLRTADPRSEVVRARIARGVAALSAEDEADALTWIESVAEAHDDADEAR